GELPIRLLRHPDRPGRDGRAIQHRLVADIHHSGATRCVDMRQLHERRIACRSSANTAASSCGFTLPCAESRASMTNAIASTSFPVSPRSEEHTSELQSRFDLVCRLLLEKKKKNIDKAGRISSLFTSVAIRIVN